MTSAIFNTVLWILFFSYVNRVKVEAYSDVFPIINQHDVYVWNQYNTTVAVPRSDTPLTCIRPDFYTCELPPNVGLPESTRTCSFRSNDFQEQVYRWVVGHGCLLYTQPFLYVAGSNNISMRTGCRYGHLSAPCVEVVKEDGTCGCFPFDPDFEEVVSVVTNSIIPLAHGRWERCVEAAMDCCQQFMIEETEYPEGHCPTTFDGWHCWHSAPNDTMQFEVCPQFAYSNARPTCNQLSSKECFYNGTWNDDTDYTTCSITPRLLTRYRFHIGVLAFSIATCLPAVFVFFFYKRLRVTRVALHRNLLIAIIIRNTLVIISRSTVYINEITNFGDTVMSNNSNWCRSLAVFERTAANAVFVCMLIEGIYLHRIIVAVFKKHHKMSILYGIGAVITIMPVIAWAIVMGLLNDHSCWVVYTVDNIQWIIDAPRICILLINTILFSDILRVLITKVRNAENVNQLSTTKVTLFLMPVFGIQFLLTAFRPNTDSCTWEEIYFFVTYTLEGLQGFIVALLYCYINKEVRNLVTATYKKAEAVVSRVRSDSNYRRSTIGQDSDRRMTFSTGLDPTEELRKDTTPNLQLIETITAQNNERLAEVLEPHHETVTKTAASNEGFEPMDMNESFDKRTDLKQSDLNNLRTDEDCCVFPLDSFSSDSISESSVNLDKYIEKNPFYTNGCERTESIDQGRTSLCLENDPMNSNKNQVAEKNPEDSEVIDSELLDEIMKYVQNNHDHIILNSDLLAPNRKKEDKIIFVDE